MASEREIFELSGPLHLTHPHWADPGHRRCIAATLVQGVYILERDRQEKRDGPRGLAHKWWSFFNFKVAEIMVDEVDGSIFGAVYKRAEKSEGIPEMPEAVVAFRGTVVKADTFLRDLKLDLVLLRNGLHRTCRFQIGLDAVRRNVRSYGQENVWIAGHSLGAAVALLAGRTLCEEGFNVETHLFNPPYASAPVERIKNDGLKFGIHVARSLVATGLAVALRDKQNRKEAHNAFVALSDWVPNLYVNPSDDISSGYVGYFGSRHRMEGFAGGKMANLGAHYSILSALGKETKAFHLIPSANLIVSLNPSPDFKRAHGIHQWWSPHLQLRCTHYSIPVPQPRFSSLGADSSSEEGRVVLER